jgi:chromosome segregation protein
MSPEELGQKLTDDAIARPPDAAGAESLLYGLEREREAAGRGQPAGRGRGQRIRRPAPDHEGRALGPHQRHRQAARRHRRAERRGPRAARSPPSTSSTTTSRALFEALFGGGQAELKLVESDDPLEAGLEIYACPPGKRLAVMSLMSGGEQALTAAALIFAVFLANPAPVCVLDEVDAPLDDANVDRFCRMLDEMRNRTDTRFIVITHNPVTMSRMDRLYGVTMPERGGERSWSAWT